ncbi:MAG: HAD-IIA family hydrolase [Halanaerobiales bacterium]|nr:HAD-IIA family hydrolase [Halanaerobiales bacterium]
MDKILNTKLFIFDMDGTIYLGQKLIDGVVDLLDVLDNKYINYIFLTNNSSKNSEDYKTKLANLGIKAELKKIVNAGEVTAGHIKKIKSEDENRVYVVGTQSLKDVFENYGFEVVNSRKNVDFLVLGFDTSLTYQKLWDAHYLINSGVKYFATNPDQVCPLEKGRSMPDCGAITSLLKTSTGQIPKVIGKPNVEMINYISEKFDADKRSITMVGDRLYTDIKMAEDSNINSILVLSGETKRSDLKSSTIKPDFVLKDIAELKYLLKG